MTLDKRYEGSAGTPGLYIPIVNYDALEAVAFELQGERTQDPQGQWLANTVQPTWEVGKRVGDPIIISEAVDISSANGYITGPGPRVRWYITAIFRGATTGSTRVFTTIATGSSQAQLTTSGTAEQVLLFPWPGLIIQNDGRGNDGNLGMEASGNGADTARRLHCFAYQTSI